MTALWVLWHRVRGHWVQRGGWMLGRRSGQIWECWTCYDSHSFVWGKSKRVGRVPHWFAWKEEG